MLYEQRVSWSGGKNSRLGGGRGGSVGSCSYWYVLTKIELFILILKLIDLESVNKFLFHVSRKISRF